MIKLRKGDRVRYLQDGIWVRGYVIGVDEKDGLVFRATLGFREGEPGFGRGWRLEDYWKTMPLVVEQRLTTGWYVGENAKLEVENPMSGMIEKIMKSVVKP